MPCDPCGVLPSELKRLVFEQLTLAELARCRGVSQSWKAETAPLHALTEAAFRAGIVPPRTAIWAELAAADGEQCAKLLGLASVHGHYKGLPSFAALCSRQRAIAEAWAARGAVPQPVFTCVVPGPGAHEQLQAAAREQLAVLADGVEPWRIKLDPEEGTLVFTAYDDEGALYVVNVPPATSSAGPVPLSAEIGVHLWMRGGMPQYSHLEADEGHLVIWLAEDWPGMREFQVWRRERDVDAAELGRAPVRGAYHQTGWYPVRQMGHPWDGRDVHAFRLSYPTLAVTTTHQRVALVDLRDPASCDWIDLSSGPADTHLPPTYIDHSPDFVFVTARDDRNARIWAGEEESGLFASGLTLIRRSDRLAWTIGRAGLGTTIPPENFVKRKMRSRGTCGTPHFFEAVGLDPPEQVPSSEIHALSLCSYQAVHFDARTSTLIALMDRAVLLIHDYELLFSESHLARFTILELDASDPSHSPYLAVRDGRAICHFAMNCPIYLIDLDAGRLRPGWHPAAPRELSVASTLGLTFRLSCIQADDASLFIVADPDSQYPGIDAWNFGLRTSNGRPPGAPTLPTYQSAGP